MGGEHVAIGMEAVQVEVRESVAGKNMVVPRVLHLLRQHAAHRFLVGQTV
jgi:hypothetical protein